MDVGRPAGVFVFAKVDDSVEASDQRGGFGNFFVLVGLVFSESVSEGLQLLSYVLGSALVTEGLKFDDTVSGESLSSFVRRLSFCLVVWTAVFVLARGVLHKLQSN